MNPGVLNNSYSSDLAHELSQVVMEEVVSEGECARLRKDGSVLIRQGLTFALKIPSGVVKVVPFYRSILALKDDGTAEMWGHPSVLAQSWNLSSLLAPQVYQVAITPRNFDWAALREDGSVTSSKVRASYDTTDLTAALRSGVIAIYNTDDAFAALKLDGSVVTWGDKKYGGDSRKVHDQLTSGVKSIVANRDAFAAMKEDGTVISWGVGLGGGDASEIPSELYYDISNLIANNYGFAALTKTKSVVLWGTDNEITKELKSDLKSGVKKLISNKTAFAALKDNGSVVSWSYNSDAGILYKPRVPKIIEFSSVKEIVGIQTRFFGLKEDGSFYAALPVVDGHVLPEVCQLQRGASVVGKLLALSVAIAAEVQHEMSHRVRGIHAVSPARPRMWDSGLSSGPGETRSAGSRRARAGCRIREWFRAAQ